MYQVRSFLRDFGTYLLALWQEWKALLTGGSIIATVYIWGIYSGKPIPPNTNWLVVGLTLILASFLAWRKQLRPPHTIAENYYIEVTRKSLERRGADAAIILRFLRQTGAIVLNQYGKGNLPPGMEYYNVAKPLLEALMEDGLVVKKDNVVPRTASQDPLFPEIFHTTLTGTEWRIADGVSLILDDVLYPSKR